MKNADLDAICRNTPREKIPWNIEEPPRALVDLVESGAVRPCRTLDLGCGTGNYAVSLAARGFEVTGVDLSPAATAMAEENARNKGAQGCFLAADVLGDLQEVPGTFDFAYDWELLHHLFPDQRPKYAGR